MSELPDNLVIRIAKMIDPGSYGVWWDGTGADAKLHEFTTRQKYMQANAELKAIDILKAMQGLSSEQIAEALTEHEVFNWKRLGFPEVEGLRDLVRQKHDPAPSAKALKLASRDPALYRKGGE